MKKMLIGIFALSLSLSSFADCTNAYTVKATHRAKVNKTIKKTAIIVGGVAAATGAAAGLVATGGAALVASPLVFGMLTGVSIAIGGEIEETKGNTFFKGLAVIEGAKTGFIPTNLLEALDKKMSYNSLSPDEQIETNAKIIKIVLAANASKELCKSSSGKIKPLNFKKMTSLIAEKLNN